jgi:hypothetical protein
MGSQDIAVERKIARLGTRAQGVVTRVELLRAGVSVRQIDRRVGIGALIAEYRGVYRAGHAAPSVKARYMAAVKACGDGALLSGSAAAYLLGLLKGPAPPPEVTASKLKRITGLKTRRSHGLGRRDATVWRGVPVTTVPRTLVDLAVSLRPDDLARAFHEAGIRHHTTPEQVEAVLARRPSTPGARTLRRVIRGDEPVTLSPLEARFLDLLRTEGLTLPVTNRPAGGRWVDCRWPDERLTVELDSYRYHRSRHAWEQDRARERDARARGDDYRRYTYGDVFERPAALLVELRGLLATSARG